MSGRRIVLCYPVQECHVEQIRQAAPGWEVVDAGQERIAAELPRADIFCGHAKVPVPWPDVVRAGRLQWIQSSAAGLDHCLVPEVIRSPIVVSGSSGLFAPQVAEQAVVLLLSLIRRMPVFFSAQQRKEFERQPTDDLHGKTVGIVGFGGNGRRLASVLSTFQVRLLATDCFPVSKPSSVEWLGGETELERLLGESDVVILCVPLNERTLGMMDAERFGQMKPGSYLINVARGPVVKERDLVTCLKEGRLAGAGLDVTEIEPLPADSPLWEMPNVVITPHVGAQAADRVDVTTDLFCENLRRFTDNQPLINRVDKTLGFPRPEDHLLAHRWQRG